MKFKLSAANYGCFKEKEKSVLESLGFEFQFSHKYKHEPFDLEPEIDYYRLIEKDNLSIEFENLNDLLKFINDSGLSLIIDGSEQYGYNIIIYNDYLE